MGRPSWEDRETAKRGTVGEDIVDAYLEKRGIIPYKPNSKYAHAFDRLGVSKDKKNLFIVEVKTKPARDYYPDTGIDVRHFNEYKYLQDKYSLKIFIFFVDDQRGEVYGNFLNKLMAPKERTDIGKTYPLIERNIIYFPLSNTISITKLTDPQIREIRKHSTRNTHYDAVTGLYDWSSFGPRREEK